MIVFEHTVPAILIWLGVISAIGISVASWWLFVRHEKIMAVLGPIRLLFFLLLGWCLLMPGIKTVEVQKRKPHFLVAIDTSESMTLSPSDDIPNRWQTAMDALGRPWVETIAADCNLSVHPFASDVGTPLSMEEALQLKADGSSTLLRDALKKIVDRHAGLSVAGCLLLTDAVDTREAYNDWASETRPFPIYTLRTEPPGIWKDEPPDVSVEAVDTPKRVTVDWKTELKAVIAGQHTKGRGTNVQLFKDNVLQQEMPVMIPAEGGSREVSFELAHPEIGVFAYRVSVPPQPGEENTNDNTYVTTVQVVDAKNRLLYVEGPPRWESKYLGRVLRANKQVTPHIFLRGSGGEFMTFGAGAGAAPDMTEEQLGIFNIVVIGNLDADELGTARALALLKFVEDGGGLVLLGGSKGWGAGGFAQSELAALLPTKTKHAPAIEGTYPVNLTDVGLGHPAFSGDPDLWDNVPPVLSVFPSGPMTAGARPLVEANTPKGTQPIIVSRRYGQGKVLSIFTDSLWKWKLSPDAYENQHFERFWDQVIAWLLPSERDLDGKKLDVFIDRERLFLGEDLEISARAIAAEGGQRDVAVSCEIAAGDKPMTPFAMTRQYILTPSGKSLPGFILDFKTRDPGSHSVIAVAIIDGQRVESDPVSFFVKPFRPESIPRPVRNGILRSISRNSRGRYFEDVDSMDTALGSLDIAPLEEENTSYKSLWQRLLVIAGLVALLTVGWIIRKTRNMP